MHDIDDLIADDVEESVRTAPKPRDDDINLYVKHESRAEVGVVERFFDKIGVVAIHLTGDLKVGDTIEIDDAEPIRIEVLSMQIDRKDVEAAGAGDSVGIKADADVRQGSKVYLV